MGDSPQTQYDLEDGFFENEPLRISGKIKLACLVVISLLMAAYAQGAGRPGQVFFSDNTWLEGQIQFTRSKELVFDDPNTKRKWRIQPADVVSIVFQVETQSMELPYTFETPGSKEKTFAKVPYPLRNLTAKAVLANGEILQGHLMSALFYITPKDAKRKKVFLKRQYKGKPGQTQADLVHVREIVFTDQTNMAGGPSKITGNFSEAEAVAAFGLNRREVYKGTITIAEGGDFTVNGLPPDTYDLAITTEREVVVGLSPATPEGKGKRKLEAQDMETITKETAKATDFFEYRCVVYVGGSRDFAKAVTYLERENPTSNEKALDGSKIWHVEVWLWHMLKTEWRLDERLVLARGIRPEGDVVMQVVIQPELGGIILKAGQTKEAGPKRIDDLIEKKKANR